MAACMVALAALHWRGRTGKGCFIDLAQFDASVFANAMALMDFMTDRARVERGLSHAGTAWGIGAEPPEHFWADPVTVQYYPTLDGRHIMFMALERKFFVRFAKAIGREDLLSHYPDGLYSDHLRGNLELRDELIKIFSQRTLEEWMRFLREEDIPGVPVGEQSSQFDDPQFATRVHFLPGHETEGTMTLAPMGQTRPPRVMPTAAPRLGADTDEILADLGIDDAQVQRLRDLNVVE
jgi:crotonobetainyl-CoA:carnitine CoA-transferase CaiB-like acyl-CoA transferase